MITLPQHILESLKINKNFKQYNTKLYDIVNKHINFKHLYGKHNLKDSNKNVELLCVKIMHDIKETIDSRGLHTQLSENQIGECWDLINEMYEMDKVYVFIGGYNGVDTFINDMYEDLKKNNINLTEVYSDKDSGYSVKYYKTPNVILLLYGTDKWSRTMIGINSIVINKK